MSCGGGYRDQETPGQRFELGKDHIPERRDLMRGCHRVR